MRIISPWAVYWITRLDNFVLIFAVGAFLLGFASAVVGACILFDCSVLDDDGLKQAKKWLKSLLIAFGICLFGLAFTPSSKEAIEMVIADNVTYETVDNTLERIEEVADHVIDKIKEEPNENH